MISLRDSQHRVMMWLTQLTRYDTNNCTNAFMYIIRLSNIFLPQKIVILLAFIVIFTFLTNILT
jgi:hypothetical protein